jgi:phosphoglycerol transferase MdoB-like AlkP superfamily enzyme
MPENLFNLNNPVFWRIVVRFVINLVFLYLLIVTIYYKYSKKQNYLFSFFLMGIVIFFLGSMLYTIDVGMGVGFVLFGVFSILRFRTSSLNVKDMSYMLTVIGISLINSFQMVGFPMLGIFIINILILLSAVVLEESLTKNKSESHTIVYNNLELLKPDNKQRLLKDISERSGRDIKKIKIRRIDYKREVAMLEIFFQD